MKLLLLLCIVVQHYGEGQSRIAVVGREIPFRTAGSPYHLVPGVSAASMIGGTKILFFHELTVAACRYRYCRALRWSLLYRLGSNSTETRSLTVLLWLPLYSLLNNGSLVSWRITCLLCHCLANYDVSCSTIRSCHIALFLRLLVPSSLQSYRHINAMLESTFFLPCFKAARVRSSCHNAFGHSFLPFFFFSLFLNFSLYIHFLLQYFLLPHSLLIILSFPSSFLPSLLFSFNLSISSSNSSLLPPTVHFSSLLHILFLPFLPKCVE